MANHIYDYTDDLNILDINLENNEKVFIVPTGCFIAPHTPDPTKLGFVESSILSKIDNIIAINPSDLNKVIKAYLQHMAENFEVMGE